MNMFIKTQLQMHYRFRFITDSGDGIIVLYAAPNPFLLNKLCLNQLQMHWSLLKCVLSVMLTLYKATNTDALEFVEMCVDCNVDFLTLVYC